MIVDRTWSLGYCKNLQGFPVEEVLCWPLGKGDGSLLG